MVHFLVSHFLTKISVRLALQSRRDVIIIDWFYPDAVYPADWLCYALLSAFVYSDASAALLNPVAVAKEIKARRRRLRMLDSVTGKYSFTGSFKLNVMVGATTDYLKGMKFRPSIQFFWRGCGRLGQYFLIGGSSDGGSWPLVICEGRSCFAEVTTVGNSLLNNYND